MLFAAPTTNILEIMKKPTFAGFRRGFTLVELLVVIVIILVLAGAGLTVGTSVLDKARKLSSESTATAIDQALNMFYSEYGTFPIPSSVDIPAPPNPLEMTTSGTDGQAMLEALLGNDSGMNPRGLNFLSLKEGRVDALTGGKDGIVYNDAGDVIGVFDFWGNPFNVVIDVNFEERLEFTPDPAEIDGAQEIRLNGRRVAVYSPGAEEGEGTVRSMAKSW